MYAPGNPLDENMFDNLQLNSSISPKTKPQTGLLVTTSLRHIRDGLEPGKQTNYRLFSLNPLSDVNKGFGVVVLYVHDAIDMFHILYDG